MRYPLLFCMVVGCAVDHTGLQSTDAARADATRADAARADATRPDATRPDAARPDAARADAFSSCDPNPCMNAGTCAANADGFMCSCASGFTGDVCEMRVDDCVPDPCLNGGVCADGVDSFSCTCAVEFEGPSCAILVPEMELAFYDPIRSQPAPESNPLPATASDPRIDASSFENITYGASSGGNYDRRPVLMSTGDLAVASTFYVTVTFTPREPTEAIALSRLTYSYASYVPGATGAISVRTSADAFTTTVDSVETMGGSAGLVSLDLGSVPVTAGALEVRLYMHDLRLGASGVSFTDWADLVSTGSTGDGMRVFGRVVLASAVRATL